MGAVGSAYDNAMVESFWGRMQVELLNRKRWTTRIELATAIHDYIELFQHPAPALSARDAHANRIRGSTQRNPGRLISRTATPKKRG
jgi:hypothetical protein